MIPVSHLLVSTTDLRAPNRQPPRVCDTKAMGGMTASMLAVATILCSCQDRPETESSMRPAAADAAESQAEAAAAALTSRLATAFQALTEATSSTQPTAWSAKEQEMRAIALTDGASDNFGAAGCSLTEVPGDGDEFQRRDAESKRKQQIDDCLARAKASTKDPSGIQVAEIPAEISGEYDFNDQRIALNAVSHVDRQQVGGAMFGAGVLHYNSGRQTRSRVLVLTDSIGPSCYGFTPKYDPGEVLAIYFDRGTFSTLKYQDGAFQYEKLATTLKIPEENARDAVKRLRAKGHDTRVQVAFLYDGFDSGPVSCAGLRGAEAPQQFVGDAIAYRVVDRGEPLTAWTPMFRSADSTEEADDAVLEWQPPLASAPSPKAESAPVGASKEAKQRPRTLPTPPKKAIDAPLVVTGCHPEPVIKEKIAAMRNQVRFCREKESARGGTEGLVYVTATISPQGAVADAAIEKDTLENKQVGACIVRQLQRLRFPACPGGVTKAKIPFQF